MQSRRETGQLESEILGHLWAAGEALTPRDVLKLVDGLAYTTVMTILARLWRKGVVSRERSGRAYAYSPVLSEAELTAQRMYAQLDRSADRAEALSHFVGALSNSDARALRRRLQRPR